MDSFKITERKEMIIELKKEKGIENQKAQVVLCLDKSGSMDDLYDDGTVQSVLEKIMPLGLAFDDNKEVDFYIFDTKSKKLSKNITLKNLENYILNEGVNQMLGGGTNYAPVIRDIIKDFCPKTGGILGFGGSRKILDLPVYVIFITDGDTDNREDVEEAIKEASKCGIFFQFIGIGKTNFNFLEKLDNLSGRLIDNANFFSIKDINSESDIHLYEKLMAEFPSWIPLAKSNNLIK